MVAVAASSDLKLHIDKPVITDGAATQRIGGSFFVEGWAVARAGVEAVQIALDGKPLDKAYYGIRRPDIAAAFPDWEDALLSGFALMLPAGALSDGPHVIRVEMSDRNGRSTTAEFSIEVEHAPSLEGPWALRRKMPLSEIGFAQNILSRLGVAPGFDVILGIGEIDDEVDAARRTLASLRDQAHRDWRVVVLRRGRFAPDRLAERLLADSGDIAERITVTLDAPPETRLTELLPAYPGSDIPRLLGVLLAGDVLGCDALLESAIAAGMRPTADLFYSDERRISPVGGGVEAFFKPQWSPDLLEATNYIGRWWCARPTVFDAVGSSVGEWFQFGDYDLVLRCTEAAREIRRIPLVLCERGRSQLDHPAQERAALKRAMRRRGIAGELAEGCAEGYYRVRRRSRARKNGALVSIIIPTCASHGLIKTCIESLRARTAYPNFEIVCIENIPSEQPEWKRWLRDNADQVIATDEAFNWSRFNNLAAREARGDFLLFLNDDVEIIAADWLDAMLEHAERPEVGVVGARLLYPDRRVQHAGIFWTPQGGRHAFRQKDEDDRGYFGLALTARNVLAVTGACLLMRRDAFEAQGRFDERHTIINNDVDYSLRCWAAGKRVVYTPHATLIHHELASRHRLGEDFDKESFRREWGGLLRTGDPFFHPALSLDYDDFVPSPEPVELVYASRPLFAKDDIHRILALKLDHIGDFVTTIPALRRLREAFPRARLSALVARQTRAFAELVPEIDEFIDFELFFARSELGLRDLPQEAYSELRERLKPYRFDLAVDLRKAPDSRPLLRCSGARWLAGFDHQNQFPWLDIVLGWEGDPAVTRKRSHIGDDLLRLAETVIAAAEPNAGLLPTAANLPETQVRTRLVCIQPGVGAAIRQWPPDHFVELIDLLIANHDVEIVLIGGPDETEIAQAVIDQVANPAAVRSLVGSSKLAELPALLAAASLFVGNNSGPHHLAAALEVPTVGIHSGAVDAREWGPVGPKAVAIRRNMGCSPCYLTEPAQCPRALACLTELRPAEVYAICKRLLAEPDKRSAAAGDFGTLKGSISSPAAGRRQRRI